MDALKVSEPGTDSGYLEALAAFDRSIKGLKDSAELARLTDDPAMPGLQALVRVMETMAAQFRLRDRDRQAMAVALEQRVAKITHEAMARVEASGASVVAKLAPELSRLVERSIRQRLWTVRLKTIFASAGIAVALSVTSLAIGYAIAYKAGLKDGLLDGKTIATAMATGPQAAAIWAQLMAVNDPVQAMKACRNGVSKGADGRRYCAIPVWLDSPSAPNSAHK
jgi:hypothetical protein